MVSIWNFGEQIMISVVGDLTLATIIFLAAMIILVLWRNLDFRFSLMLFAPGVVRMAQAGWIPSWVEPIMWIFAVGIGLYLIWTPIANR